MKYARVMKIITNNNPHRKAEGLFGRNTIQRYQQNFNNQPSLNIKERSKMQLEIFRLKIPCLTVKVFEFVDNQTVLLTK